MRRTLLAAAAFSCLGAGAVSDWDGVLTGGSSRAWMVEGAASGCDAPDSFTFDTHHSVGVVRCSGGRPVSSRHGWRVSKRDGTALLAIEGVGSYALARPGDRFLVLRRQGQDGGDFTLRSPEN